MLSPPTMAPGDLVIRRTAERTYTVVRFHGETIGVTASEQEALILACAERRGAGVWEVDPMTGRLVRVDCPVASALQGTVIIFRKTP